MKLKVIGSSTCRPCFALKVEIESRIDEIKAAGLDLEYINLTELGEEKDMFIESMNLLATPTAIFVEGEREVKRVVGYMNVDSLLNEIGGKLWI